MIRSRAKINIVMLTLLIIVIFISLFYGAVKVPLIDVIKILSNKTTLTNFEVTKQSYIPIVFYVRFPRILIASIVGGALAVCGCTMQSLLKNPIADSGIIGISSGASLGAVIAIATGLSAKYTFSMPILSVFSALIVSTIIYRISNLEGKTDNLVLILSGIAISSFIGAISSMVLTSLMDSQIKEYIFWSIGSLSGRRWEHFIFGVIPISFLSFTLFYYSKELNVLLLGNEEAKSLGINIASIRKKILIIVSIMTSISVCISGNIGFIGLVIPHMLRKIIGSDNRLLLKSSFIAGAFFLTLSDLISRTILAPSEISVGIITSLIGTPYFIYLIIKIKIEGKGS